MVSIIFIIGWWKCSAREILKPSANIPTRPNQFSSRIAAMNYMSDASMPPRSAAHLSPPRTPRAVIIAAALSCVCSFAPGAPAQTPPAKKPTHPASTSKSPATKKPAAPAVSPAGKVDQQLSALALALRDKPTAAAEQHLADFAQLHAKDEYGLYADLALGHYNLDRNHLPDALKYFAAAEQRPSRLEEYAMFWHAQTLRQSGHNEEGIAELAAFRKKFPDSVLSDLAVQSFAEGAIAQGNAQSAAAALDAYPRSSQKSILLLLRAQAREKSGSSIAAAKDYLALYYGFPLTDESRAAGQRIPELSRQLGDAFPAVPLAQQVSRGEALFAAHRWREARQEFEAELAQAGGADHDHAELRIQQCKSSQGGGASPLTTPKFTDPDAEAERLFALSQAYRNEKHEREMLEAITEVSNRFPQNQWTAEALFVAGNYYWVLLDRPRAADYYHRAVDAHPTGKEAPIAAWRFAWAAYMNRKPETVSLLEAFIKNYPTYNAVPDALYWLGRSAERAGNLPRARSFYVKASQRFPQTFFGLRAADKVAAIGSQPLEPAEIIAVVPDAQPIVALDAPIPPEVEPRWLRAAGLRLIGFDASAELELRTAYGISPAPRLLLEAAQSATAADHYGVGIMLARMAYPQPDAHRPEEMPASVAHVLYPLPFFSSVTSAATRDRVDPMIVAGVMRQESAFLPDAVSHAGAVGLMQVLPKTAPHLSKRLNLRYSRAKLFDPDYNVQLGTLYLADLINQFGTEGALAAYNAGEDRSKLWKSEHNYDDAAEFVESIPFTETRDYVQIVMRNAQIYRILNPTTSAPGSASAASAPKTTPAKSTVGKTASAKSKLRGAS
jgi:soluble lytic murein transglycosylase